MRRLLFWLSRSWALIAVMHVGCSATYNRTGGGKESGVVHRDGAARADAGIVQCPYDVVECAGTWWVNDAGKCECLLTQQPCLSTLRCPGNRCDPALTTCSIYGPCSRHADCGSSRFCNRAGRCEQNFPGGPCDTDENCWSETCRGGFCGCVVVHVAVSPGQCSYPVVQVAIDAGTAVPTDVGANMWVAYIGLEIVSRDETHQNGWDYDRFTDAATTFYGESTDRATFYGDACRRLSGDAGVPDVAVVGIDCPLPPLPL